MSQDHNYGLYRENHAILASRYPSGIGVGTREERTWSALAHLSIFLNLFTGFLGPVAALVIWMVYRGRSGRVASQAMRSLWYQMAWLGDPRGRLGHYGDLEAGADRVLADPRDAASEFVPFVHAAYAAYKMSRGVDYRYLWATELLRSDRWG